MARWRLTGRTRHESRAGDRLDTVGGSLTVASRPGGGTTVTAELPVAASMAGVPMPRSEG